MLEYNVFCFDATSTICGISPYAVESSLRDESEYFWEHALKIFEQDINFTHTCVHKLNNSRV
jgi:hypothetical protein